jgi:hypothetical protein
MKFVVGPDFLHNITKEAEKKWLLETGENVSETVEKDFVKLIGKPIADLIK